MSFALQKLWFLWGPICQFLILQNKQFGVLLRNLSPVPISLRLFSNFFSIVFSVSGFMCSSLFPLDFSIVQGDKNGSIYILLHANHLLTQNHLLKMLSSFHWMVLAPLQRSSDHRIYRFISVSSILFHWSTCLTLYMQFLSQLLFSNE